MAEPVTWTGVWSEAEAAISTYLESVLGGKRYDEEFPDSFPDDETVIWVADLHGAGPNIQLETESFTQTGAEAGSAVERLLGCTLQAITTTKALARAFSENLWNATPVEPGAKPLARLYVDTEPEIERGTMAAKEDSGAPQRYYQVTVELGALITKAETWG